mgnify:CR=1 FL=1
MSSKRLNLCLSGLAMLALLTGCSGRTELSITSLKPGRGPFTGGDPVEISGSGFQTPAPKGVQVFFGRKAAPRAVIVSDSVIHVEPPGGETGQVVDVEVVFDDSRVGRIQKAYTYFDPNKEKMSL